MTPSKERARESSSGRQFTGAPARRLPVLAAWAVHLYTALGVVCGLGCVLATVQGDFRRAFLWLVVATFIDATDGVLARAARVKEHIPHFDGARLDDIVDYLTYVFAPVFLMYRAGVLPEEWGVGVAAVILLSSAYGFAAGDAKADDHFFTGFPSYWNIVAVYLFAAEIPQAVNGAILLALSALVFVRVGYVYPTRTPTLRGLTISLGAVWASMVLAIILMMPEVPRTLLVASLYLPRLLHRAVTRAAPSPAPGSLMQLPMWSRRVRDRVFGIIFVALVVLAAITMTWVFRQGYAVHRLTRGVGDTWFLSSDGKRWFRMDEHHQDVPLADIPAQLQQAFIAVEDHRFYHHPGVDPIALGRAVVRNVRASGTVEGGSTLTQQLARTLFLSNKRSYGRKAREAVLAIMIDAQLTKTQILELYLNRIYLSAGVYGVETMSRQLFGKPAKQLTLAESALIAGLAQSPAGLSPWTNLDGAVARSHVVLTRMRDQGFITAGQEETAKYARIKVPALSRIDRCPRRLCQGVPASALPRRVRRRSSARLGCADDVRAGTAGDRRTRRRRRPAPLRPAGAPGGTGRTGPAHRRHPRAGRRPRLPAVAVQPRDAQPASAWLGVQAAPLCRGTRERLLAGVGARRAGAHRAPGPRGVVAAQCRRRDSGCPDAARGAARVEQSRRDDAAAEARVEAGAEAGVARRAARVCPTCRRCRSAPGLVTPLDMTAAFATFPNGGLSVRPRGIRRVTDADGVAVFEDSAAGERVISEETAFQMVSMLEDVVDHGTGSAARQWGIRSPIAGKTGTTNDFKDAWFVGFSSSIVVGVWVGFDQPQTIGKDAYGSKYALPIWSDFMRQAMRQPPGRRVRRPADLARGADSAASPTCGRWKAVRSTPSISRKAIRSRAGSVRSTRGRSSSASAARSKDSSPAWASGSDGVFSR